MAKMIQTPRDVALPYQLAWMKDRKRFKLGLWSRQTGKDFSSEGEAVEDCNFVMSETGDILGPRTDPTRWTVLATGERQALESLDQAKTWTAAYNFAIEEVIEDRDHSEALLKSAEIIFANGSKIRALPANPATARGSSTNLILTEFAFHEKPDDIWRAIYPSLTNPLRGGEKKLRIITTPNGMGNKFADLWFQNYNVPGSKYSCHKVTIEDAVRMGLPVDIEELKAGFADPDGWAQEYMVEFIDGAAILLPYELLALCENPQASTAVPFEYWEATPVWPRFMGIDFGRKKDLTVAWTIEKISNYRLTREVLELAKTSTPDQVDHLRPRLAKCTRCCLDYTGPGVGLGDYLVKEFGEWNPEQHQFGKIELCTFTQALKVDIFPKLRMACEAKAFGLPVSRSVREDLHSIYRINSTRGGVTYGAPHTPDGHSDRGTAAALCERAAAGGSAASSIGRRFRGGIQRANTSGGFP